MKKNMKKLWAFLCVAVLVLGLTACGSKETAEIASDYDDTYLQTQAETVIYFMTMLDDETKQYYIDMDSEDMQEELDYAGLPIQADAFQALFESYLSYTEELGAYVSTDGFDIERTEDEITVAVDMTFETHEVDMTIVFDADGVATTMTFDPVYSMGEILKKAGLNTVIGMGTVFAVLIFISFLIGLLPKLTGLVEGKGKKEAAPVEAPKAEVTAVPAEELADDLELVAVISAAIAAYTGSSTDDFVVRSIKRSNTNKWKKA